MNRTAGWIITAIIVIALMSVSPVLGFLIAVFGGLVYMAYEAVNSPYGMISDRNGRGDGPGFELGVEGEDDE